MAKAKIARNPELDPTLPKVSLTLDGKTYFLCFTFGALALAESKLRAVGLNCNLLIAFDITTLDATRIVPTLYAALITHCPEMTPEDVAKMVTFRSLPAIVDAICKAYEASVAEPSKDVPAPLVQE